MEEIGRVIHETYGIDISRYDDSFLMDSVKVRLAETGKKSLRDYSEYLAADRDEATRLTASLKNTYSEFFRNPLTFAYLEQVVIPLLAGMKKKGSGGEIRVWSANCAVGQEPYSLAMILDEFADGSLQKVLCRVFATDIDKEALVAAQKGIFHSHSLGNISMKRFLKYFSGQNEPFRISQELKEYIDFSVFDLLSEEGSCPPPSVYGNFDIILCCNILFYYKPLYRQRILMKINHCLASGGFLVTSETERAILKENNYREVFVNSAIFRKSG